MLPLLIGQRDQFGDVLVTATIHGQQGNQMGLAIFIVGPYPEITANNGFDPLALGGLVEFNQSEKIAVVSNCAGWHAHLGQTGDQGLNANQAVGKGELGV